MHDRCVAFATLAAYCQILSMEQTIVQNPASRPNVNDTQHFYFINILYTRLHYQIGLYAQFSKSQKKFLIHGNNLSPSQLLQLLGNRSGKYSRKNNDRFIT